MAGYERVGDLMTKHPEVATFKRFDFLNTLNILYLQAELVHLEQELRESMRDDLEFRNEPTINSSFGSQDEIETAEVANIQHDVEKGAPSITGHSKVESEINVRLESTRDWYFLANSEESQTWEVMLKAREKLKEYNEAVLRHKEMMHQDSPNKCDVEFLRRWFKDEKMGDFPLRGDDSEVWETSKTSELIAFRARKAEDPLSTFFLRRVYLWWHHCIGHRFKKTQSEEVRYFEYRDRNILRVANFLSSIISSALFMAAILTLYFVTNQLARLGIIAAFTTIFSLVLVLATTARKIEVFAATAA
ncbi:uncharacterized protein LY89DRAFT_677081 [Mollisia scopiformis]|uniref:DUF6594 domain-containing protein n=1 Tax=Mollisia scopiformis TaxID=149040 RepID=A0A132B773_MOLSC|nr:uncharacterized protein LY89DRAFT_677081 [Mollisia scopiformis]KUJ08191.1 hypothetical protein LY89DRAFT_677081 [Mollisia scopiformis]